MRRLRRHDAIDDIYDQMQSMINQLQRNTIDLARGVPVDIEEENGKYILTADLPGVQKEDIDLKADEDTITIAAEASQELEEQNEKYIRRERSKRAFQRTVAWPTSIDTDTVKAKHQDGVLTVEAEKEDADEEWNIEIE